WYQHWLELRYRAAVAMAGVLLAAGYLAYAGPWTSSTPGLMPSELRRYTAFLDAQGPEAVRTWGTHAAYCSMLVTIFVPLILAGSAVSRGASGFLLSLPISRCAILLTRTAAACAGAFFLSAMVF